MSKTVRVRLFDACKEYGVEDWPPEYAAGFMEWFRAKLASIPDGATNATVTLGYEDRGWESYAPSIEIAYDRPYTSADAAAEAAARQTEEERTRTKELKQLARLEAKYRGRSGARS